MNVLRIPGLQRVVLILLLLALVLPTLVACASKPSSRATVPLLAGIVVDNLRLARPAETGLVTVWRDGAPLEGRTGLELRLGDLLQTGPSATAVIRYPGGSELLMRPGSSGRIGSFTEAVGEFFAKIRGRFAIETQFVRAGALGTQYLVRTAPGGATTVVVFDGAVEVRSTTGAWPAQIVEAGAMVVAHPRAPVLQPARADEALRTREWVERVEKLVPPTASGVSVGKTIGLAALFVALGVAVAAGRDRRDSPPNPNPSGDSGRGGAAGTDQNTGTGAPAPPLTAPTGMTPGAPQQSSAPGLTCASPVTLSWSAVAGAADYAVTLEMLPANSRSWQAVSNTSVRGTSSRTAAALSGMHRWRVQARNVTATGPLAGWLYFSCTPYVLR